MQPTILLLREGTDQSQGKAQVISNINACQVIVDIVRTTLGPRGMDKLVVEGSQDRSKVTISNDGATIMKLLDIVHPAAKVLVEIAKSQGAEVGDGTTSVVVLAGELLKEAKTFIDKAFLLKLLLRDLDLLVNCRRRKSRNCKLLLENRKKKNEVCLRNVQLRL